MPDAPAERPPLSTGASLVSGAQIAMAVLGGLASIIVARILGPEDTGAFNVIAASFLVAATLSTAGVHVGLAYYVARREITPSDATLHAQVAALPLGILGAGAVLGVAALGADGPFRGIPFEAIAIGMAFLPFSVSMSAQLQIVLAADRHRAYAIAGLANMALYVALAAVLTPLIGLEGAVLSVVFPYAVVAVALVVSARRSFGAPSPGWWRAKFASLRRAVAFGSKSYASYSLNLITQRVDVFILNGVAAQAVVGEYTVAVAVTMLGLLVPRSLSMAVLPRVASLTDEWAGGQDLVVRKAGRHGMFIAALSAVGLALGVLLIPILYGSDFSGAVAPGLILAPGVAMLGASAVLAGAMTGKGRPEYALYTGLIVTPPTLVAYFLLIPALEAEGAALASTLSYGASLLLSIIFYRRVTGIATKDLVPGREEVRDYMAILRAIFGGRG